MTQQEADKIVLGMGCHPYSRLAMIDALLEGEKIGKKEQKAIYDTELAKLKKELLLATTFAVKAKEKEIVDKACEWLMKYFVIDHEGMSPSECDVFLRKFRKATEG